jgi:hypothetical protein
MTDPTDPRPDAPAPAAVAPTPPMRASQPSQEELIQRHLAQSFPNPAVVQRRGGLAEKGAQKYDDQV